MNNHGPLTIDLDSTICETYGLGKEGARQHGYTGQRGYHPLLAVAADTGDVLMARLRQGRANTARGAAHFLRETVGRVRYAGASGPLTVRADGGFYTHAMVAVCRKTDARYSITVRQHQSLRNLIEAIPEADWTPIPYWMDAAADVAETEYTPFESQPDAAPARLIVRRVKPTPGSQLALIADYSYHASITDRDGDALELEVDLGHVNNSHAEIENAIRDLKYGVGLNHLPSGRFAANAAWLAVPVIAHNLVWYVGMRQADPTWVEENRGPAWSSHPILIEPEQLPGPIEPVSCKDGPALKQEVQMEGEPRYVGIDVSKAQVDVAIRPTGRRWVASYDETGIKELVSQMVGLEVWPESSADWARGYTLGHPS